MAKASRTVPTGLMILHSAVRVREFASSSESSRHGVSFGRVWRASRSVSERIGIVCGIRGRFASGCALRDQVYRSSVRVTSMGRDQ